MTDVSIRRQLEYLAAAAAVVVLPVFTYMGYLLFEDPLWGGVAGLLVAAGTYLFTPPLASAQAATMGTAGGERPDAGTVGGPLGGFHRAAAGLALGMAGVAVLATGFAVPEDLLLGVLVGALVAVIAYLPLSWLLPGS